MTVLDVRDPLVMAKLDKLIADLRYQADTNLGFPDATDLDVTPLLPLFGTLLNNVGGPFGPAGPYRAHTKGFEREVVEQVADLFRAPWDDRWGYVTSGATEGTLCALWQARTRLPTGVLVASTAAHYSVARMADLLRMRLLTVGTDERGEMDYGQLTEVVERERGHKHRKAPVIVVATVGTTMTEAVDDVQRIHRALDWARVPPTARWVHADAALSGIPLGLVAPVDRPRFDIADGATSIVVSGHKFLGTPLPCAVLVVRDSARPAGDGTLIPYTGGDDATVAGSRSGHAAVLLWWALHRWGIQGLRARAAECRELAEATVERLNEIGWRAWRHPHAFTVVIDRPPQTLLDRWPLAVHGDRAHLVCMPGKTAEMVDAFIEDLRHVKPDGAADAAVTRGAVVVPRPRSSVAAEVAEPC